MNLKLTHFWLQSFSFLTKSHPPPMWTFSMQHPTWIQQLRLTDRRIILVMAQFVTLQSSRPLNMFKHIRSREGRAEKSLLSCYLSSHAGWWNPWQTFKTGWQCMLNYKDYEWEKMMITCPYFGYLKWSQSNITDAFFSLIVDRLGVYSQVPFWKRKRALNFYLIFFLRCLAELISLQTCYCLLYDCFSLERELKSWTKVHTFLQSK